MEKEGVSPFSLMAKKKLSREDLIRAVNDQLNSLAIHTLSFEQGHEFVINDMAMRLRVLLHHYPKSRSHSLINQLDLEDIPFLNTASPYLPNNLISSYYGLVSMQMTRGKGAAFVPKGINLDHKYQGWVFKEWWNGLVIKTPNYQFTRSKLVLTIANQAGGGHVDPTQDKEYYDLKRSKDLGWTFFKKSGEAVPMNNPDSPSIQQIAMEVLATFHTAEAEGRLL